MIEVLLLLSVAMPLLMALLLAVPLITDERRVAQIAQGTAALCALTSIAAIAIWISHGARLLQTPPHILFERGGYRFTFQLTLDLSSVVFVWLVQFTTGMVLRFSRFYLHREPGFRRFFAVVLMFQSAMCVLTLAANLDLMLAGWEMVGLSSFLLIAFYWERHSAIRNALKTYSVYRIADMGMLLAACLVETGSHRAVGLFLLLAAMGKSAQFPFSFWVPRAMEGPTPSSALFYGALSVHAGAYLLLHTFDLWSDVMIVRVCIAMVGVSTALLCSMFSRVQPTIKGHVGYASVTQVGWIFVEIALGFNRLALVHIVCNALLRCYQLLVSPSAVAYLLRRQASAGSAQRTRSRMIFARSLPESWISTLYVFALSEGYLKDVLKLLIWSPLRWLDRMMVAHRLRLLALGLLAIATIGLASRGSDRSDLVIAWMLIGGALVASGGALGSWRTPLRSVAWLSGSSLALAAAVFAVSPAQNRFAALSYGASISVLSALGFLGTKMVVRDRLSIHRYAGLSDRRPLATALMLFFALGIAGFPLLPTFLGEDLLLHDTLRESVAASALITSLLALNGYLAVRSFAFTFLGGRHLDVGRPTATAIAHESLA